MSTHAIKRHDASPSRISAVAVQQIRWLAGGLALGFLVPFVFADQLGVQRDLYYGIYAASVFGFFVLWARATEQSIAEMVRRRWIHRACEDELGRSVSWSTVKTCLSDHSRGRGPRFQRVAHGLYAPLAAGRSPAG